MVRIYLVVRKVKLFYYSSHVMRSREHEHPANNLFHFCFATTTSKRMCAGGMCVCMYVCMYVCWRNVCMCGCVGRCGKEACKGH